MSERGRWLRPIDAIRSLQRRITGEIAIPSDIPVLPATRTYELPQESVRREVVLKPLAQVALEELMDITGSSEMRIINQTLVSQAGIRRSLAESEGSRLVILHRDGSGKVIHLHNPEPLEPDDEKIIIFNPKKNTK